MFREEQLGEPVWGPPARYGAGVSLSRARVSEEDVSASVSADGG